MDSDKDLKYKIHYYCREKYFQTAENLALEGTKNYPDDASFKLYTCFCMVLCGRYQESIRELEHLINLKDVNIGATLALITAHKACHVVDKEAVLQLDNKLKTERKVNTDLGLYYGALFLYFIGKISKSLEYLERFLKANPESSDGLTLKGWLELSTNKSSAYKVSCQCFKNVLEKDKRNLDASLGLIKINEIESDLVSAMSQLNQLIVKYSNFLPPLIEKMKVQLASNNWDLTVEIANRILTIDGTCLEAFKIKTLALLCRDGNFEETALSLKKFYNEIEKTEKKNGKLFYENAQLFSYLSSRNAKILSECYSFAEKAAQLEPSNPDYLTELGYQNILQGNIKEAVKFFKSTTKVDESSIAALTGLTMCQIQEGVNEQVKQQVEFLREIQTDQPSFELLLMSAKLAGNAKEALEFLNQATRVRFDSFKRYPYGVLYLYHLNPVSLMDIVAEYLKYAPTGAGEYLEKEIPEPYEKSIMILEEITVSCPGLIKPQYEYAYVMFLTGNLKKARQILTHILDDLDATSAEAHILMAQIHLKEKNYQQGAQSLEVGISYNFKIREHPVYHLITAIIQKQNGNLTECINSLKSAMAAAGVKSSKTETKTETKPEFSFSLDNKVMLYLETIDAYQHLNQTNEALKLVEDAMEQFKGTSEEGRVMIANAEMLVKQGKITQGIEMLQKIHPGDGYYTLAKKTLANIYLVNKRDPELFTECYKELVENRPSVETYVMLGDAYMSIQEADQAIGAYEKALSINSKDVKLICKMGKALVKTHHFSKAINFYKEAVKNDGNFDLIYDIAELYFKLGQLDNAERVLTAELENGKIDPSDWNQIISRTKLYQLLAKVRDKSGNLTESLTALKTAKENYIRIDKRILSQSEEHKEILSQICSDMAILLTRLRDFGGAIKCYKESLTVKPEDPKILSSICRLHMQVNDFDECLATSKKLLATDPSSEPAIIMLADLAFRKLDFDTAALHYKQLLDRRPTYWTALARLIEVMRRMGNLEEVNPYLEKSEAALLQPSQDPGYSYCKGLYEKYLERPSSALQHFNRARKVSEWGPKATQHMIEICLNPDNETLRSDSPEEFEKEDIQSSRDTALRTAQRLLSELKAHQGSDEAFNHRLLSNFWLLATNQKSNIEKALQDLVVMATQDLYKEHVGVALGIATAYMLQKQVQKARNQLKRFVKNQWNYEDAEYLEKAWLLLTDIYIQSGKMDLPVELIQKILQHNKGCFKAYDYAGLIAEKEQLYKEAALQYENAWKYCGQNNPAIGYKLAFNYLKGKRYAEVIDVCYTILKLYPDYPRIHKEILEKAKTNLRT